jgi:hypothetical protein
MVSIAAFQAVDPGSIPGRRNFFNKIFVLVFYVKAFTTHTFLGLDLGSIPDWHTNLATKRFLCMP